jgi:hypothetical protein
MQFADIQEARDFLAQHPEVRSIELMLIDSNGIPRGKLLHRDELLAIYENGRPLPSSILALTIQGEDVEESGLVWEVADADCWTYPLPGSLTLQPWRNTPTGQLQVSMHPEQGWSSTCWIKIATPTAARSPQCSATAYVRRHRRCTAYMSWNKCSRSLMTSMQPAKYKACRCARRFLNTHRASWN